MFGWTVPLTVVFPPTWCVHLWMCLTTGCMLLWAYSMWVWYCCALKQACIVTCWTLFCARPSAQMIYHHKTSFSSSTRALPSRLPFLECLKGVLYEVPSVPHCCVLSSRLSSERFDPVGTETHFNPWALQTGTALVYSLSYAQRPGFYRRQTSALHVLKDSHSEPVSVL